MAPADSSRCLQTFRVISAGVLTLLSVSLASAQVTVPPVPPVPPAQSATTIHADTNLVLVDIVVTEKDKPAHGIDKSKFHLFEDGKERPIASLEEHKPGDPIPMPPAPALLPGEYTNRPNYPSTAAVNVLLLDGLNTAVQDQMQVRAAMVEYLGRIRPGTPMAIFTLASQLHLVQGFTTDPAALLAAAKSSKTNAAPSPILESQQSSVSVAAEMANLGGAGTSAVAALKQFETDTASYRTDLRVRMTLDALKQLSGYLAAIPGRKNLIWLSGTFPIALMPQDDPTLNNPFSSMRNYQSQIEEADVAIADARVAIYPVDARGLINLPLYDAGYRPSGTPSANPGSIDKDNQDFAGQQVSEQQAMDEIAKDTGGHATRNTNDFQQAVAQAVQDGSSYYTLTYRPPSKRADGSFHEIKVKVDGGNYRVVHRRGYYARKDKPGKPESKTASDLMLQATLRGAPPATGILLRSRILPGSDPQFAGKIPYGPAGELSDTLPASKKRYVVDALFDVASLDYTTASDGTRKGLIEVAIVAYNAEGKRLNYTDRSSIVEMTPDQYTQRQKTGIAQRTFIDLPPGQDFLRIAIHDANANKVGSLEIPVTVPQ